MRRTRFFAIAGMLLLSFALIGCSGGKKAEQEKAQEKKATEQAAEAIKQHAQRPLDKARSAQQIGNERTKAIDEALSTK